MLLFLVLAPLLLGSLAVYGLGRRSRLVPALVAGAITATCLGLLLCQTRAVMDGQVLTQTLAWAPEIGLTLALRLDGLSFMFAGIILGIGLLIVVYAHYYLSAQDSPARFFALMMVFMAAMLGVVLSDNLLVLAVFWELTSIASFLLIGFWYHKPEARAGARQALTLTGGGGLALLGGMVLLGQIAGTYELSAMLAEVPRIQADPRFQVALVLIVLGALTKSAQFPFHFWLPDAMAAPTPVSAYLHSATMVKAGIFLLMRLYPVLGAAPLFIGIVTGAGLLTVVFAAFIAIFKHDLKGLLAYSTISHLGLMTFLIGLGSPLAVVAAVFHVLNHAAFKASLFMIAGIVDHETHSRDMRQLGSLWGFLPFTATLSMVAAASMAGIPLTNGFLSKEMFFAEAVAGTSGLWSWLVPAVVTVAGLFSVAYSLRFVHDTYFHNPLGEVGNQAPHEPPLGMKLPVVVLAGACMVVGVLPALAMGDLIDVAARAVVGRPLPDYHLSIWHGLNLPLLMTLIALGAGVAFYFWLVKDGRLHRIESERWFGGWSGRRVYEWLVDGLFGFSGRLTGALENASLQRYAGLLLAGTLLMALPVLWDARGAATGTRAPLPAGVLAHLLWALLLATCWMIARTHTQRFKAVVLVGLAGLVTALAFVALSAPDLALTQLAVELVCTVLLLMGLALLPALTKPPPAAPRWSWGGVWPKALLAAASGLFVAWLAWMMLTREHASMSWYFLENAIPLGGGANAVNVILVDFRGYDTLGEVVVLGMAALGVSALLQGWRVRRPLTDAQGNGWTFRRPPLMLRVAAVIVLPLALLFAAHIFLRGHNLPGGGFIAGLITAVALVLQYMALGQQQAQRQAGAQGGQVYAKVLAPCLSPSWAVCGASQTCIPSQDGAITFRNDFEDSLYAKAIAWGLAVAGATGALALAWGYPFLTSAHGHWRLPWIGQIHWASAMGFDLGVYLAVAGGTLLTIYAIGAASRDDAPEPPPATAAASTAAIVEKEASSEL